MSIIPAKLHGVLDYAVAATLIVAPLVLNYQGVAKYLAVVGGIGLLIYSLLTDYSLSVRKLLSFKAHLVLDFIAAMALTAAPFIFGFTGLEKAFHLVIGVSVIAVVLITNSNTAEAKLTSPVWHLNEVYTKIDNEMVYHWQAVDDEGIVLGVVVQRRWDTKAALRLLRKLLKNQGIKPTRIVTDRLGSYGARSSF